MTGLRLRSPMSCKRTAYMGSSKPERLSNGPLRRTRRHGKYFPLDFRGWDESSGAGGKITPARDMAYVRLRDAIHVRNVLLGQALGHLSNGIPVGLGQAGMTPPVIGRQQRLKVIGPDALSVPAYVMQLQFAGNRSVDLFVRSPMRVNGLSTRAGCSVAGRGGRSTPLPTSSQGVDAVCQIHFFGMLGEHLGDLLDRSTEGRASGCLQHRRGFALGLFYHVAGHAACIMQ